MKIQSIVLPKHGDASVFKFMESELDETLGSKDVIIKVAFSGINFADIHMRQGLYPDAPRFPYTPGYEVSGKVIKIGKDVEKELLGMHVMAGTHFGGYSSHVKIPSWQVFKIQEGLTMEQAAATPVSFLTAYFTLVEVARVKDGDRILVDCASGSLGSFIIQILKKYNVEATGVTSSESKIKYLSDIGYIAKTIKQLEQSIESFDITINTRGSTSVSSDYKRLKLGGRVICLGASNAISSGKRNLFKALKTVLSLPRFSVVKLMNDNRVVGGVNLLRVLEEPELLKNMMGKAQDYNLNPKVDKVFKAQEVMQAHQYIETKQSKGKVLLSWND